MTNADDILKRLDDLPALDWRDFATTGECTREVLRSIASTPAYLDCLLRHSEASDELYGMAEHFERIDRLVLYDDLARGIRIRLHVYPPAHFDGPHDHRWSFSSIVLHGGYQHCLYQGFEQASTDTMMMALVPCAARHESMGACYSLHHSLVHSVVAQPGTVSIILRGPAEKERLMMTDLKTGRLRWKYGIEREPASELRARRMSEERYGALRRHLLRLGLISSERTSRMEIGT